MQRSAHDAGVEDLVEAAFADPAFALAKAHGSAFAIVRTGSRDLVWANAAAAALWGSSDVQELARTLFGPDDADGRGWLGTLTRGFVPDRAPQLARLGPARGFGMRGTLVLGRSWTGSDGRILTGFAVPETGAIAPAAGEAWRRPGIAAMPARADERTLRTISTDQAYPDDEPHDDAPHQDAGSSLARRSQLAILRDRLNAAVDGAPTVRLLWRTDRDDIATQIDDRTFARLGAPARFSGRRLPEVLDAFDPEAALRIRDALATRLTWSGILVRLPVAEAAAVVPMHLSASPVFGPDRGFIGFRGFGTIDLAGLDATPPRPAVAADADQPPAVPEPRLATGSDVSDEADPAQAIIVPHPADDMAALTSEAADDDRPRPGEAGEPSRPEPEVDDRQPPSANVVHLRRAPAGSSARAPAPVADNEPPRAADADALAGVAATDEPQTAGRDEQPPEESDELAFLALGDALRAQIDSGPQDDSAPSERLADPAEADASAPRALPMDVAAPAPGSAEPEAAAAALPLPDTADAARLLDRIPTALLVTLAGVPVFANRAAAQLLGYGEPADLLREGERVFMAGSSDDGTATLRTADGEPRVVGVAKTACDWHDAVATLWRLEDPSGSLPLARAAPQSGEAEDGTGDLLDRVDDAVLLLDAGGHIRRMNRRGESWFARPGAAAILGQSVNEILAPDSRGAALALMDDVKAQKEGAGSAPLRRDVLVRTADHLPVPMVLTMGRVGSTGFYATLRDISALKRAETGRSTAVRDPDRGQLPDVLAKVSHEIRTPLNAILGFAEIIMDERFGPLGNPRYKDYLKDIHASGTQVMALVSDLLDLSRIESGQIDLDVGAVDVNRIVSEGVAQMQSEAHRERIIMRTSLGARIPSALVDERSARQIVQNLLSNAVKFNEPGGQVIVSTALGEAGTVVLRVRDTGVGMSDDEIAAALEPFQRTSSPRPSAGNGLGLPLTRALIGANGASLAIRSRPREGTLVEVAFAAAEPGETRLPA